jgi:hypothetical protein
MMRLTKFYAAIQQLGVMLCRALDGEVRISPLNVDPHNQPTLPQNLDLLGDMA